MPVNRTSKTLLQVGKSMIDSGRTSSDLRLDDLLQMDPAMLPPRMRGQKYCFLFLIQIYPSQLITSVSFHFHLCVCAAKVMQMKKPNPIYKKESSKIGAYPPNDVEKSDKFLPKKTEFTKVVQVVLCLYHSIFFVTRTASVSVSCVQSPFCPHPFSVARRKVLCQQYTQHIDRQV